jgi:hypothetical protein
VVVRGGVEGRDGVEVVEDEEEVVVVVAMVVEAAAVEASDEYIRKT